MHTSVVEECQQNVCENAGASTLMIPVDPKNLGIISTSTVSMLVCVVVGELLGLLTEIA